MLTRPEPYVCRWNTTDDCWEVVSNDVALPAVAVLNAMRFTLKVMMGRVHDIGPGPNKEVFVGALRKLHTGVEQNIPCRCVLVAPPKRERAVFKADAGYEPRRAFSIPGVRNG